MELRAPKLQLLGGGNQVLEFIDGDGTRHRFFKDSAGWHSPPGVNLTVDNHALPGTYTLTRPDGVAYVISEVADSLKLTQIKDRRDNTLTFAYLAGELDKVTDNAGRFVKFEPPWVRKRLR